MIRIGYQIKEKEDVISNYLHEHPEITRAAVFTPDKFHSVALPDGIEAEQYNWDDIIMYRVFYPLLEKIDDTWLIVVNECLRTRNRNELTYNCLHHYIRQTKHRIVFEYFPFVETDADTAILLDKDTPDKYKMQAFQLDMLKDHDVHIKPQLPSFFVQTVELPEGAHEAYESERNKQFSALGNGDPDNIPRRLHVWAGRYKKIYAASHPDILFVARNKRLNMSNVVAYSDAISGPEYQLLDIVHRRMDFTDFLKITGQKKLTFISTGLPVDHYYASSTEEWLQRLEDFYASTGLYQ